VKEYQEAIADTPKEKIAFVDETGIDQYIYREYGRAKRGEKVIGEVSGRKFKRVGVVAARMGGEIIAPLQYGGTMNSALFEKWFENCLLPALPENSTIVMDNASFHRKSRLVLLAQTAGHRVVFLPPYSPELNPIENFWSWLKARLRKILPDFEDFDSALSDCFNVV
jgi:transposase